MTYGGQGQEFDNILPSEWGEWRIIDELGEGSYGTVYEAEKVTGDIRVVSAVKIIRIPGNDTQLRRFSGESGSKSALEGYLKDLVGRYSDEIRTMYRLQGNANIVLIQDHLIHENTDGTWTIYIRMERLENFSDYLIHETLSVDKIVTLGISLCNALLECEKHHILHRDIKPDNIFVNEDGVFKLGDFGVARFADFGAASYTSTGTANYMAPEVYKGQKYGSTADLYSVGLILYRLLNNNTDPFLDPTVSVIGYEAREKAFLRRIGGEKFPGIPSIGHGLNYVILKACAFLPEERYQTAGEMKAALELALGAEKEGTQFSRKERSVRKENTGGKSRSCENEPKQNVNSGSGKKKWIAVGAAALTVFAGVSICGGFFGKNAGHQQTETSAVDTGSIESVSEAMRVPEAVSESETVSESDMFSESVKKTEPLGRHSVFKPQYDPDEEALAQAEKYERMLMYMPEKVSEIVASDTEPEEADAYAGTFESSAEYESKNLIAVKQSDGTELVNIVRYHPTFSENEAEMETVNEKIALTKEEAGFKIKVDRCEELPDLTSCFYPEKLIEAIDTTGKWCNIEDSGLMYLDTSAVYRGTFVCTPKFVWEDENGGTWMSVLFLNGHNDSRVIDTIRFEIPELNSGQTIIQKVGEEIPGNTNCLMNFHLTTDSSLGVIGDWSEPEIGVSYT